MKHNCPNCGAPVYVDRRSCPYCETAYYTLQSDMVVTDPDFEDIERGLRYGIITANEAKKIAGLSNAMQTERLYDEALEAMRKYSTPYYDMDCNLQLEMIR